MPQCKAKFCNVKRGQGISTFPIPDPKKNKQLCEQWINKLGIENLNIKTFKFSRDSIVCAKHFEDSCFKEDMQARIMGYTPKYKYLKDDAIPTIFEDTLPPKPRETTKRRLEKRQRLEMIEEMMQQHNELPEENQNSTNQPSTSGNEITKKTRPSKRKRLEIPVIHEETKYVDIGIQVQPSVCDVNVDCNIQTDRNPLECSNCFARENPSFALNDHMYTAPMSYSDSETVSKKTGITETTDTQQTYNEESDDDNVSEFKTPTKEYKEDPTYIPSDENSDTSPTVSPQSSKTPNQSSQQNNFVKDKKFIIFWSCILELFGMIVCNICKCAMDLDDIRNRIDGTCLTVTFTCMEGHSITWRSQPLVDHQPAGNILTTAAILLSGGTFSTLENFASTLKLQFISRQTYHKTENELVIPVIDKFWTDQINVISRNMQGRQLVVSGDGRCDSPGFCAKYCTYTIMESVSSAILGFNVIQVTETENSATKMELEGFKRTLSELQNKGLSISVMATDRHVQIRKHMKDHYPQISHQFDVWHMSKSVRKKLIAAAKKKGNEDLMPWVRSISNHLWYCASQCMGDADLMEEMWTSIVYHMQNIHEFEGKHFTHCGHDTLSNEEARKKKWLNKGSKALKCLKDIVHDKRLLKDIKQLNLFCHTGELESYHSMMLKYAPKRLAFGYPQMVAKKKSNIY